MSVVWNLWHGCKKISEGCANCYMFRSDAKFGRDSLDIHKTQSFNLPIRRGQNGNYKIPSGTLVYTCFTSDFFIEEADVWHEDAWTMIRQRNDLHFLMTTKRVERIAQCLPADWGDGYDNVTICCTVESQQQADKRLPIYNELLLPHKTLICEPLLTPINLKPYLVGAITKVVVGGESGENARPCHFDWVMDIRVACIENKVAFVFKQTGANFVKNGKYYRIPRKLQQAQARKANINFLSDMDV